MPGLPTGVMKAFLGPQPLRALGRGAVGAGLGAGLTAAEYAAGVADPNVSTGGHARLLGQNMALGAALASPGFRGRMFTSPRMVKLPNTRYEQRGSQLRPGRILGAAGVASALPTLNSYADSGLRASKQLSQALNDNPEAIGDFIAAPGKVLNDTVVAPQVDKIINAAKDTASTYAPALAGGIGAQLAGGLGGGLIGGLAGSSLGSAISADDERLPYEQRRKREQRRRWIQFLGQMGGGLGGTLLASHAQVPLTEALMNLFKNNTTTKAAEAFPVPATLEEAATHLAMVKAAADPPAAAGLHPSLAGAGIGAGLGGLLWMLNKKKNKANVINPLLTGAALGALGGGVYQHVPQLWNAIQSTGQPVAPDAQAAAAAQRQQAAAADIAQAGHILPARLAHTMIGFDPRDPLGSLSSLHFPDASHMSEAAQQSWQAVKDNPVSTGAHVGTGLAAELAAGLHRQRAGLAAAQPAQSTGANTPAISANILGGGVRGHLTNLKTWAGRGADSTNVRATAAKGLANTNAKPWGLARKGVLPFMARQGLTGAATAIGLSQLGIATQPPAAPLSQQLGATP